MTRKVLVVGGSGVFGARLVDGILATSDLDMVVAGRHRGRLEAFIAARAPVHRSRLSAAIVGMVQLEDVEHEFRRFCITTTREASRPGDVSLFQAALGPALEGLPAAVRAMHEPGLGMTLEGQARVDGPSSMMAAIAPPHSACRLRETTSRCGWISTWTSSASVGCATSAADVSRAD